MTVANARPTLPHGVRLRRAADFAALKHAKGSFRGRYFMLRYGTGSADTARLGIAVSRRVSKRAVERNRLKRHVRESFRHNRRCLPAVDVLVIAYRSANGQQSGVLRQELDHMWSRIKPPARVDPQNPMKA